MAAAKRDLPFSLLIFCLMNKTVINCQFFDSKKLAHTILKGPGQFRKKPQFMNNPKK